MKRKFFSILALLVATVIGGINVWADDLSVTWAMGGTTTATISPEETATGSYAVGEGLSLLEATKTFNEITFSQLQPTISDKGTNSLASAKSLNKYIEFEVTPASGLFTPTQVSFDIIKIGTGDPTGCAVIIDGEGKEITIGENFAIRRNNDEEVSINHALTVEGASASEKAVKLRIYIGKLANNKQVGIANVVVKGTLVTNAHTHSYATEWSSDANGHWHVCKGEGECDALKADSAAHVFGTEGIANYTCTVCSYVDADKKSAYEAEREEIANTDFSVTLKDGVKDAENWVITPASAKPGTVVTFKYKGAKQIKSIKVVKKKAAQSTEE